MLRFLVLPSVLVLGLPSLSWAARPMITDDARLVDAKSCQVESWVRRNRDSTEFWALPSCNFSGNLELTLGGARTRDAGRTETTDAVAQGKTLFRPLATDSWGAGSAPETVHPQVRNTSRQVGSALQSRAMVQNSSASRGVVSRCQPHPGPAGTLRQGERADRFLMPRWCAGFCKDTEIREAVAS